MIELKPTTLLQIFCEFMFNSKVIFISIKAPDGYCQEISRHESVQLVGEASRALQHYQASVC